MKKIISIFLLLSLTVMSGCGPDPTPPQNVDDGTADGGTGVTTAHQIPWVLLQRYPL